MASQRLSANGKAAIESDVHAEVQPPFYPLTSQTLSACVEDDVIKGEQAASCSPA